MPVPPLPTLQLHPQPTSSLPGTKNSWIDLDDLKSQILKRLGQDRSHIYFRFLNGFLSQKLSKREFNKICIALLGSENIPFHNHLIRAILQNATQAKTPPPLDCGKFAQKPTEDVPKKSLQVDDGSKAPSAVPQTWSNGDILPPSPCKSRTGIDSCRTKDWPSSLGASPRSDIVAHQPSIPRAETVSTENGQLYLLKRPLQQQHVNSYPPTVKRRREGTPLLDVSTVHSNPHAEATSIGDEEDIDHSSYLDPFRGPLQAPLGIPFCAASVGGARKTFLSAGTSTSDSYWRNHNAGELCHTEVLKATMSKIAEAQGLEDVKLESAHVLNHALDAYLKRLIRSCIKLRVGREHAIAKQSSPSLQHCTKHINGIWPRNNIHVRGNVGIVEDTCAISMNNLKVAMELNPQQLGENWPLLLEKICFCSFEE
ncbi:uncharacterized protein LOC122017130 [Zingiber officinale]|uniref:uncharacterized protein LOC122017130 n=1 Tax=Zingiber officinale TaxID=94328 RepID=UPI001C4C8D8A|nr:uncharacterized protein LOC122017130 [Zingiber officinale]XP_042430575.1 uncharacterized protein LOC122017130 [Zingiber officinale]XP_042430576.1 uncharacterized protein LOC122017130 [Zingiber officinale]XP_042430577.1 uncharacterized protein LOC122017130 [Zingiber officinale]XP_042430578.1 uncharacterized protein LOC122017130 [Zingiber officinale]XP_042430579.1 uncharacterized protein LOC122017130 [Zingiber officinale]XP_042430580.1 uncharacterized protein LOC122017130 [Zingiber officinal